MGSLYGGSYYRCPRIFGNSHRLAAPKFVRSSHPFPRTVQHESHWYTLAQRGQMLCKTLKSCHFQLPASATKATCPSPPRTYYTGYWSPSGPSRAYFSTCRAQGRFFLFEGSHQGLRAQNDHMKHKDPQNRLIGYHPCIGP